MARAMKKVPLDPPAVLRARERTRPVDNSVVLAKLTDGTLVQVRSDKQMVIKDGQVMRDAAGRAILSYFQPWPHPVEYETLKALKSGIAQAFTFRWCQSSELNLANVQATPGWTPVKKDANEVLTPNAYGDKTDNLIHWGDLILHKRPREYDEAVRADIRASNSVDSYLEQRDAEMNDQFASAGIKDVKQTFEPSGEQVVFTGDGSDNVEPTEE